VEARILPEVDHADAVLFPVVLDIDTAVIVPLGCKVRKLQRALTVLQKNYPVSIAEELSCKYCRITILCVLLDAESIMCPTICLIVLPWLFLLWVIISSSRPASFGSHSSTRLLISGISDSNVSCIASGHHRIHFFSWVVKSRTLTPRIFPRRSASVIISSSGPRQMFT